MEVWLVIFLSFPLGDPLYLRPYQGTPIEAWAACQRNIATLSPHILEAALACEYGKGPE
jgi:hypothetical protein